MPKAIENNVGTQPIDAAIESKKEHPLPSSNFQGKKIEDVNNAFLLAFLEMTRKRR